MVIFKKKNLSLKVIVILTSIFSFSSYSSSSNQSNQPTYVFGNKPKKDYTGGFTKVAEDALNQGIGEGIENTTTMTIGQGFSFIPTLIKRLGLVSAAFVYKMVYGSRGLNYDLIALNSTELSRVLAPYTIKSYASTDRVKRMAEIDQEMNNEVKDPHWDKMQEKIKKIIENAQAILTRSLPCYNLKFFNSGMLKKMLANCVQMFSMQDNEQIGRAIIATINDLETLKEYIGSFKSLREVDQNTDHLKKWLAIVLGDLNQLGILIEGDAGSSSISTRSAYPTLRSGGLGGAQGSQFNDLLAAAA